MKTDPVIQECLMGLDASVIDGASALTIVR